MNVVPLELLLAVATASIAVVALVVVERVNGPTRLAVWSVPVGCCVLGIGAIALTVLALPRGLDMFGVMHLWYLVVVLAVPLTGAGLLVLVRRRGGTTTTVVLAALMLVPAPVGLYATHIAPFQLRVDRQQLVVHDARAGDDTIRVAVLADLQTTGVGDHERRAVQAVLDARPDVIVVPGDLFQGDEDQLGRAAPEMRRLLERLRAPGGVFVVRGDTDGRGRPEAVLPDHVVRLDDRVVRVPIGDRTLRIGGTRLDYASPAAEQVRRELRRDAGHDLTLLVSHRPDTVLALPPDAAVDLTIAGHTHGGQIALPVLGPPLTLSAVPRAVGAGGLHEVRGNPIYVSTGVGMERGQAPQVRLGAAPSVGVIDLRG